MFKILASLVKGRGTACGGGIQKNKTYNKEKMNMQTKILSTSEYDIALAGEIIAGGGLVAFPTETVYGLGANALNEEAVKKIYLAKGRPSDNPLIVHIAKKEDIYELVE